MPRKTRDVPKEIASFGERQFQETGAERVEILRVKAATMRKHFSKLRGITYLVGVVNLDHARVYFFDANGMMLVGENVEHKRYDKIRKSSRLLAKFEKVKPPTDEELRIEATEELRNDLAREIRRVVRGLGVKEPEFPTIFVTRARMESTTQGFGLEIDEDGAMVFDQATLESTGGLGVVTRAAFLQLLEKDHQSLETSQTIGNAIAMALLSRKVRDQWREKWFDISKGSPMQPLVGHLRKHIECYSWRGFSRILELIQALPASLEINKQLEAIKELHDTIEVPLGTEEHITIKGFCGTLSKPRKLASRRHLLDSIHLAPRAICDPTPLGVRLSFQEPERSNEPESWLEIEYARGSEIRRLVLTEGEGQVLESIDYHLDVEDIFPKSGGIVAHGKSVLTWILHTLGVDKKDVRSFESHIEFTDTNVDAGESAVLERLMHGGLDVLSNTLIGSPQRIDSLMKKGRVILLPDFNHVGIRPTFLLIGERNRVVSAAHHSVEATLFHSEKKSFGVVATPAVWTKRVISAAAETGVEMWPILNVDSNKNLVRSERVYISDSEYPLWSDGKSS
ncbi:MAG: hypothetical protein ACXADO_06025 [Candidatus Thorarchaeota archaeon]|jgi:hypothetical protein